MKKGEYREALEFLKEILKHERLVEDKLTNCSVGFSGMPEMRSIWLAFELLNFK